MFEPGTGWHYGEGIDWAGQLVERVSGLTLEEYCQEHIFKPLSLTHTTYRLLKHPQIQANLMAMTGRNPDGTLEKIESIYPVDPEIDMGGGNLYTSAPDFLKILSSLLRNDGALLSSATVDFMFTPALDDPAALHSEQAQQVIRPMVPPGTGINFCLAGLVNKTGLNSTGRKAESVSWPGSTGCYWWIDRLTGVCGFYASQLMDSVGASRKMNTMFEKAVYNHFKIDSVE